MTNGTLRQIGNILTSVTSGVPLADLQRQQQLTQRQDQARELTGNILSGQFQPQTGATPGFVPQDSTQSPLSGQRQQMAELAQLDPQAALGVAQALNIPIGQPDSGARFDAMRGAISRSAQLIRGGNLNAAVNNAQQFKQLRNQQGIETPTVDEFLADPEGQSEAVLQLDTSINPATEGLTAGEREFASLTKDFSEEELRQARRVKARIAAPAGISAAERIATDPSLTESVAQSEAVIAGQRAGAQESAKLGQQLKFKPAIQAAIKKAEAVAKEEGATLTELNKVRAAMPGLQEAVGELRRLAPIATFSLGGKAFDEASRQLGFGATKGATARAKFIATINNQVLPLLKPTFGAAFTVQEGESLKATMGDPDLSPDEKLVQLDAFIEQKFRDIETKEAELGGGEQQVTPTGRTATNPQTGEQVQEMSDGSWRPL